MTNSYIYIYISYFLFRPCTSLEYNASWVNLFVLICNNFFVFNNKKLFFSVTKNMKNSNNHIIRLYIGQMPREFLWAYKPSLASRFFITYIMAKKMAKKQRLFEVWILRNSFQLLTSYYYKSLVHSGRWNFSTFLSIY